MRHFLLISFFIFKIFFLSTAFADDRENVRPVKISTWELYFDDENQLTWMSDFGYFVIDIYPAIPEGQTGATEQYWVAKSPDQKVKIETVMEVQIVGEELLINGESVSLYYMPSQMYQGTGFEAWAGLETENNLSNWSEWAQSAEFDELYRWASQWKNRPYEWALVAQELPFDDLQNWATYLKESSDAFTAWAKNLTADEQEEWVNWAQEASMDELESFKEWIKPCPSHVMCSAEKAKEWIKPCPSHAVCSAQKEWMKPCPSHAVCSVTWTEWVFEQPKEELNRWINWLRNTIPSASFVDWAFWNGRLNGPLGFYR